MAENKVATFIKEARGELKKVNWPTRDQTIKYTGMVIGFSLSVAIFLGVLDYFFEYVLRTVVIKY
ncbi:MAG: preprotein translocase subunit SecE [Parcubacteria group bacterium]|jgi:preprotein translocase subunit SecE